MDETTKKRLFKKNEKISAMVIERAKRDLPEDIALIGLTGSFSTDDYYEKSDLDLIIVNNSEKGWELAECFIYDDVGYDVYCTSWENLEEKARLENPGVSSLTNLQILYAAKPEHLQRFNTLRAAALKTLAEPIGKNCIERAKKHIGLAKQAYADALLSHGIGSVRLSCGCVLYHTVNALVNLNNTCIQRGVKRYLEELLTYRYLPVDFERKYMAIIEAKTVHSLRSAAFELLEGLVQLEKKMEEELVEKPIPNYDNLRGTYEELWCNCRNKVLRSAALKDKNYAFLAALGAQNYLDEMRGMVGTPSFDLFQHFDAERPDSFRDALLAAMEDYAREYEKVGRKVLTFDTFEELYAFYMKPKSH